MPGRFPRDKVPPPPFAPGPAFTFTRTIGETMTHKEAFEILRKFSKRIDIDSSSSIGGYNQGDKISVEFDVWIWNEKIGVSGMKRFKGGSLEEAVNRAVTDLTPITDGSVEGLDASLDTINKQD